MALLGTPKLLEWHFDTQNLKENDVQNFQKGVKFLV